MLVFLILFFAFLINPLYCENPKMKVYPHRSATRNSQTNVERWELWCGFEWAWRCVVINSETIITTYVALCFLISSFLLMPLCIFSASVKKKKTTKKMKKKNYRVNAKYAIVPFYTYWYDSMLVWNGAKPIMLTCFQKVDGMEWKCPSETHPSCHIDEFRPSRWKTRQVSEPMLPLVSTECVSIVYQWMHNHN